MLQECADLDDDMDEDGVKPSAPPLAAAAASAGRPAQASVASPAAAAAPPAAAAASVATAPPASQATASPSPAAVVKPIASIFMKPQPKAAKVPAAPAAAAAAKAAKAPAVAPAPAAAAPVTAASPSLAGPKSKAVAAGRRKGAAAEEDGAESGSDGEEIEEDDEEEEGAAGSSKPVGKAVQKQKADATKVCGRSGVFWHAACAKGWGVLACGKGCTGMQEALVLIVWMDSPYPYRLARVGVDSLWIAAHTFSHFNPPPLPGGWCGAGRTGRCRQARCGQR